MGDGESPDGLTGLTQAMTRRAGLIVAVAIMVVTVLRLAALNLSQTDLYVDEAQYWSWAQTPAWGYYSKPPMVAWLIALAQGACGSGEACVRSPSALSWAVTAAAVAGIAGTLFGRTAAIWAGLAALLAPGAVYSARIISTDAPLLAFWALALLAFVRLRAGNSWRWAILLALAFGLGLLSKYAMLYFAGVLIVAAVVDPASRALLCRPTVWVALAVGTLALVPNLLWQATNGMATLRHTADNASGGGLTPGIPDGLEFFGAQFLLAGPVVFAIACGAALALARRRAIPAEERLLLAFSGPIVILLTLVAFVTRAHANWAATALVAVFVLGSVVLVRRRAWGWLGGGLAFGLIMQVALPLADANANRLTLGGEAIYERTIGWRAFGDAVAREAAVAGTPRVITESRSDTAALLYYARELSLSVWPSAGRAENHFQMDRPLTHAQATGPILAIAPCQGIARFTGWATVTELGELATEAGPGPLRRRWLYRLEGPPPTIVKPSACP